MKNIIISIQPKWCELIASGKKTLLVRARPPQSWQYVETPDWAEEEV